MNEQIPPIALHFEEMKAPLTLSLENRTRVEAEQCFNVVMPGLVPGKPDHDEQIDRITRKQANKKAPVETGA